MSALGRWARAASIAAFVALASCPPIAAQPDEKPTEYTVKAAFLYKFGGYVEWPDGAFEGRTSPLTIGVAGSDRLAEELSRVVAGRNVAGREIAVRRLRPGDPLTGVHVLFIGHDDPARLRELLAAADDFAVLTVTENEDALPLGSMINFVVVDDKVRFDVALPPAEERRIRISSRLLAVARKVVVGR